MQSIALKKGLESNKIDCGTIAENVTFKTTIGDSGVADGKQNIGSLQQLNNDNFPVYSPGNSLLIGCETFTCPGCGSTFICKSSINFHLNRRSIFIKFKCDSCPSLQVFYNRCNLHAHIKSHAKKGEPAYVEKAIVLPIPRTLMLAGPTTLTQPSNQNDYIFCETSEKDVSSHLEISMTEGEARIESQLNTENVPMGESKSYRCSECDMEFDTFEDRQDHLTNKDELPPITSCCPKCGILCPSECSSKAHKRLHLQVSPYVCPECGDNPDRYWESFQRHLTYHCFHYSRCFGYKCALCNDLFLSTDLLKQHTSTNHIEILYKCQMCPMAFTNFTSFQVHKRKGHAVEMATSNLGEAIQMYKCVICDVVFLAKDECDVHSDSHLKDNICKYAYRCGECNKIEETKSDLRDHIKCDHAEIYEKNIAFLNPQPEAGSLSSRKSVGLNFGKLECLLCHAQFTSRQGHAVHVAKSHGNHRYPCGACGRTTMNRMAMVTHGKEHLRNNFSICLLCHNKPMRQPDTIELHLLYHIERLTCQTLCPICEMLLTTSTEALEHLRGEHLLLPAQSQMCEISLAPLNSEKEKTVNAESDIRPLKMPKSTNFNNRCENTSNGAHSTLRGIPLATRLQTGENTCVKCDFKCTDRSGFKEHLLTHKVKKSNHQCQECGLCFVVEPSLKRHLRIAHKIIQVENYLKEEGSNYSPEAESVPEVSKTNDLECSVCYEIFASETLLKTHMRSHGMAFIQATKNSLI